MTDDARARILKARLRAEREYRDNAEQKFEIPADTFGGPYFDWLAAGTWLVSEEIKAAFEEVKALRLFSPYESLRFLEQTLEEALERYNRNYHMRFDSRVLIRKEFRGSELWRQIEDWLMHLSEKGSTTDENQYLGGEPNQLQSTNAGRRGYPANAEDHAKVANVVLHKPNWRNQLADICRELQNVSAIYPGDLKAEGADFWDELADYIDEKGSSPIRERLKKYIRYRMKWVARNQSSKKSRESLA